MVGKLRSRSTTSVLNIFPKSYPNQVRTGSSGLFRVRFWKNVQHGSCRSRSELSDHIKFIKIGHCMKNLGQITKNYHLAVKFTCTAKLKKFHFAFSLRNSYNKYVLMMLIRLLKCIMEQYM